MNDGNDATLGVRAEQEEAFRRYRQGLQRELMRLASFIELYRALNEPTQREATAMTTANGFFAIVDDALFLSIIVSADRLLGQPRGDEWNLRSFLKFAAVNLWMFDPKELPRRGEMQEWFLAQAREEPISKAIIDADIITLESLASLNSVRTRRDGYHAHSDKRYLLDPARLHKDAPLVWGDLPPLIDIPKQIFNRYSVAFDGSAFVITPINATDVSWLLSLAADGLEARQRR